VFKKWGIIFAVVMFVLSACSKNETEEESGERKETLYTAPFTGVDYEEEVTQRPILVTINNHPQARPQSGIAQADVVYEMVAEGNITRFLALFQSEIPDKIGPIRSARDYFIDIAEGLDAFYIAHGYSPDAQSLLNAGVVDHLNGMQYDGVLFDRSPDRKAPHNSYITKESLIAGAEKVGASMEIEKTPIFSFYDSIDGAKIGSTVSGISIQYGSGESFENFYSYISEEGMYERKSAGIVTIDEETQKPVKLSNLIFMEIPHKTVDNVGRKELTLTDGGNAYLFQAGVMKEIAWANVDGVLVPMENGVPAKLVKGKTWISFVPTDIGLQNMVNTLP
jgi:hypothetical protein